MSGGEEGGGEPSSGIPPTKKLRRFFTAGAFIARLSLPGRHGRVRLICDDLSRSGIAVKNYFWKFYGRVRNRVAAPQLRTPAPLKGAPTLGPRRKCRGLID